MIHNIREAFNELLEDTEWMDDVTRAVAKEKANSMNERIGYPEFLTNPVELSKEYDMLEVWEVERPLQYSKSLQVPLSSGSFQ
ncbi:endothelin-converting enzyme homolog [Limulus polyphemus]|uniref:Endothelin-converting enzyme homolog n=1 Tax=Limulus polyphemus TaxID=6850 RepID=A0ABM1RZI2_LIMPO|nr:endothelin-converting enzyme homolog [Limulus polyphemus]